MTDSIHAHTMLSLILSLGEPCPEKKLEEAIEERFGATPVFHTCSHQNLSPRDLIALLLDIGKLEETETGLCIVHQQVCQELQ